MSHLSQNVSDLELDMVTINAIMDLPEKRQHALMALAAGAGMMEVARLLRVNRKTIYRWTTDPVFDGLRRDIVRRMRALQLGALREARLSGIQPKLPAFQHVPSAQSAHGEPI